uniref:Uncharacterized protein n=1 Tax=Triticum urartu TaxID=4572 RepID=A0A8R7U5T6_TRIUA
MTAFLAHVQVPWPAIFHFLYSRPMPLPKDPSLSWASPPSLHPASLIVVQSVPFRGLYRVFEEGRDTPQVGAEAAMSRSTSRT